MLNSNTILGNQLDFDGGDFFRPKFISRPKINEGDTLLQGRYGNFINFSSNVNVLEDSKNIISKKLAGGSIKIVDITFDSAWAERYGEGRYNIYVIPNNNKYVRLWKSIPSSKCVPEYELEIEPQL